MEEKEKTEQTEQPKNIPLPPGAGMSGYATLTLRDAKTGEIKQQVSTKNQILARGLDWIIAHIVSGHFAGSSLTEGNNSTYHGQKDAATYISVGADVNPFKFLNLLHIGNGNTAPDFTECHDTPSPSTYLHVVMDTNSAVGIDDGTNLYGKDKLTYDSRIGDTGSANTSTRHTFAADGIATRTIVLGSKSLSWDPSANAGAGGYTGSNLDHNTTDLNTTQSKQSNEDTSTSPQYVFQKVYLVFNFDTDEGNGGSSYGINSIAWASDSFCSYVGARLEVSPAINKTNADTLDITYTFDLTSS